MWKYKEHNEMITQENKNDKTWGGFNLAILKVKQIHYERIEVLQKDLDHQHPNATSSGKLTTTTT